MNAIKLLNLKNLSFKKQNNAKKYNLGLKQLSRDTVSFSSNPTKRDYKKELSEYLESEDYDKDFIAENQTAILGLMEQYDLEPQDATDIISVLGNNKDKIEQMFQLNERINSDGEQRVSYYNIASLIREDLSEEELDTISAFNRTTEGCEDFLFNIISNDKTKMHEALKRKKYEIRIIDIKYKEYKKRLEYKTVERIEKIASELKYDEEKLKQIEDFIQKASEIGLDIDFYDAMDLINNGYTPEKTQQTIKDMKENNFPSEDLILYINMLRDYGKEVILNTVEFVKNLGISDVSLSYINGYINLRNKYGDEFISDAVEYAKNNNMPFDNAKRLNMVINIMLALKDAESTSEDDIFPKKLSKDELKEKYSKISNSDDWDSILADMYSQIRRTNKYAVKYDENYSGQFDKLLSFTEMPYLTLPGPKYKIQNNWIYMSNPKKAKKMKGESVERVSLNVKGDYGLIYMLNKLMNKTPALFSFKVPDKIEDWIKREDPVTMYFYEEISPKLKDLIAKITEPYARGRINSAEKDSPTPWMTIEKQPTEEEIEKLLQEAKELDEDLYKVIDNHNKRGHLTSTGFFKTCLKVIEEYKASLEE